MVNEKIMRFNRELQLNCKLPKGIYVMNPFMENPTVIPIAEHFYAKYYKDNKKRHLILGINPGRLGAGATGIPFTDTKRLEEHCGIPFHGLSTHEPSSVFVYKMIEAFGGPKAFYKAFYISSICPLGFLIHKNGKTINYNYYDQAALQKAIRPFAIDMLKKQLQFGIYTDTCFCFGTGKNFKFIQDINAEFHFFDRIVALEHPRYIMQYKSKHIEEYITKYLTAFNL